MTLSMDQRQRHEAFDLPSRWLETKMIEHLTEDLPVLIDLGKSRPRRGSTP